MDKYFYTDVPTWKNGVWEKMSFDNQETFFAFLEPLFKEPGEYGFDETSLLFNEEARKFEQQKFFCDAPYMSRDYTDYWDTHKERCRKGVFYIHGDKTWFLTRELYMWLNFLRINNKESKRFEFASFRDVQYHMALYEFLAELNHEHVAIIKKRQIASSYYHCARFINKIWFEETPILKLGASEKRHVDGQGDWKFLEEYRSFLNENTAWYRPMNPGKPGLWQQQIEVDMSGRKVQKGLKGVIQMLTFEKAPEKGIGGPCSEFFYDEGGNAPTADITYRYLRPAMRSGLLTTGLFMIAGSVGELEKAQPLKKFIYNPRINGFRPVTNKLVDTKGTVKETGLFIPEQWSMPPFIDLYGNSDVPGALKALDEEFAKLKKELSTEEYQLEVSQRPRNLEEAFAWREESVFPLHLVRAQQQRIDDKKYFTEFVDIIKNSKGELEIVSSIKGPIRDFPVNKADPDKEGCIEMYERPHCYPMRPELGKFYYASVDPIGEGKTITSESLFSVVIYKIDVEVVISGDEVKSHIEHGKIVAEWCGRFDDINKTHERAEYLIELYGAWTIVENNIPGFITHMINKKKQYYLVPKAQMSFLTEVGANEKAFQVYGWRNTGVLFKTHLLSQSVEFCKEELDHEVIEDEDKKNRYVRTKYGIERIPSIMLLKEMENYQFGVNVDRLTSFAALVAFVRIQQAAKGYPRRVEYEKEPVKDPNLYAKPKSFFIERGQTDPRYVVKKGAFRNLK